MLSPGSGEAPYQHAPALGLTHRLLGRFHVTGVFWYRFSTGDSASPLVD